MDKLAQRILKEGSVTEDGIICVDSFLNHMIDTELSEEIAREMVRAFRGEKITKVLTSEASGIALACFVGQRLDVPVVFARRHMVGYREDNVFMSEYFSYGRQKTYLLRVARHCLDEDDRVLIVDDILANGMSMLALIDIVGKAHAELVGVTVAIEKGFDEGGKALRRMGVRVEPMTVVESIADGKIVLAE